LPATNLFLTLLYKKYTMILRRQYCWNFCMRHTPVASSKSFFLFPFGLLFLLIIGIFVSVIQIQHQQTSQSRASVPTPTPGGITNCSVTEEQIGISEEEQALFDAINSYRRDNNVPALVWSDALKRAAAWMSLDMSTHNSLSHTDSAGRSIEMRVSNCGYPPASALSELIDSGTSDPEVLLSTWQHAPSQNSKLLDANYKQIGLALVGNGSLSYWTVDLGTIAPTPTPTFTLTPTPTRLPSSTPLPTSTTPTPTLTTGVNTPTPTQIGASPTLSPTIFTGSPTSTPLPTKQFTPTNTPVPTIDPRYVANPNDTQLFIAVKLIGIGKDGNPAPRNSTRKVQVGLYDVNNELVKEGTGYLTFDKEDRFTGVVHFGSIPNGTYYVKVQGDNTLRTLIVPQFQAISNTHLNIMPTVTLVQGDLNADNVINLVDYNLALLCFQKSNCDSSNGTRGGTTPTPTPVLEKRNVIDFNDNGVVDVQDYNILLQNYWTATGD
jgi:uncharacterized protein YkwD